MSSGSNRRHLDLKHCEDHAIHFKFLFVRLSDVNKKAFRKELVFSYLSWPRIDAIKKIPLSDRTDTFKYIYI